jgi:hypothetical protein
MLTPLAIESNLALFQLNIEFLANLRFTQEKPCWKNTKISIFLDNLTIFFIHLGILSITCNIGFICRPEFLFNIKSNFFQIKGFQGLARTFSQFLPAPTENLGLAQTDFEGTLVRRGSGKPPYGCPMSPSKKSNTEAGKSSSSALSMTYDQQS